MLGPILYFVLIVGTVQSLYLDSNIYRNNYPRILDYENNVQRNRYNFKYLTEDSIYRDELGTWKGTGRFKPTGEEIGANTVKGYTSYRLSDGSPFRLSYVADENGYRPSFKFGVLPSGLADKQLTQISGVGFSLGIGEKPLQADLCNSLTCGLG